MLRRQGRGVSIKFDINALLCSADILKKAFIMALPGSEKGGIPVMGHFAFIIYGVKMHHGAYPLRKERAGQEHLPVCREQECFRGLVQDAFLQKGGQLYRHRAAKDEIEDSSGVRQTDHYEHPQKRLSRAFTLQKDNGQDKQDIDEQQNEFYQKNVLLSSVSQRL